MAKRQSALENMVMQYKEIFEKTYRGKKILLTGHTGFKGSWMLVWLHQLGAIVKGYALQPEDNDSLYNLVGGDNLCDSIIADIRDRDKVMTVIDEFHPDFIFHFAAQPLVRVSYEMPLYTFEVNVNGTGNVLEALRKIDKPCSVVVVTTDKVYENRETDYAYKETDNLGGYDPYSASKAAAEILVGSYRNSFFNLNEVEKHGKAIATARAGNVIGGGDWSKDRIIPDIIRALRADKPVIIRNPKAIRPWQHVLEPLSGYLLLGSMLAGDPKKYSEAWNFGPDINDTLNVGDLAAAAIQYWGNGKMEAAQAGRHLHEAKLLKLDITKSTKKLKWIPKFSTIRGLERTIHEYKELVRGNNDVVIGEINYYCQT